MKYTTHTKGAAGILIAVVATFVLIIIGFYYSVPSSQLGQANRPVSDYTNRQWGNRETPRQERPDALTTTSSVTVKPVAVQSNRVTYACENNKTFSLRFNEGQAGSRSAEVTLSNGNSFMIYQAASATGERYSSKDGTFVFSEANAIGTVQANGKVVYTGCRAK